MISEEKRLALASLRVLYLAGMLRVPANIQTHLRFCHNNPADCLICKMTQLQIEDLSRRMAGEPPQEGK